MGICRLSVTVWAAFLCGFLGGAYAKPYVACSLPLPPHTMPDSDGTPTGYASEVLLALAKRLNWSLDVRFMPWLRVVEQAKAGHCDLVYTVLKRNDYEEFMVFPAEPLSLRRNVLLVRADSGITYDGDLESFMRRHSVGLYQDKAVDERFERLRRAPWAKVDVANDAEHNMKKFAALRFDAAIENEMTAIYWLRQQGQAQLAVVLEPPLNVTHAYVAFPKAGRLARAAPQFDVQMAAFRRTAAAKLLEQRYLRP